MRQCRGILQAMSLESLTATLALIGIVILISSLLSGAVERTGLPQVAIFLLVGAALGPWGLGLVRLDLDSPPLEVIATLGLVLVLFSDAIGMDVGELRLQRRLALGILGPGTLLPAAILAFAAWQLLGLSIPASAILGAALASTDPVLLRTLVRHPSMPPTSRMALRLESGMNDVILLPIVVLSMLALGAGMGPDGDSHLGRHLVGLFLLGPALGMATGYIAIMLLDQVRKKAGVRRDYESLYALGVAFTAYAAAESVGGSGFLAAFAAGLTVAALDVELCDCFLDYGEASAEIFLLLTFVAFGASLIWTGLEVANLRTMLFALVALVVRTAVLLPVLSLGGSRRARPVDHRAVRSPRIELAAARAAPGVRRNCRQPAALLDHLPGGAAVGGAPRGRDRPLSAARAEGGGRAVRASGRGAVSGTGGEAAITICGRVCPRSPRPPIGAGGRADHDRRGQGTDGGGRHPWSSPTFAPSEATGTTISRPPARYACPRTTRCVSRARCGSRSTRPSCSTVREWMKPQAPVWRESFEGRDGAGHRRWSAGGPRGRTPACR